MPLACTIGHKDLPHCSLPVRAIGVPSVIVGGLPWSCLGDKNMPHLIPVGTKCIPHTAPICRGSGKVIVGGRPAGLVSSNLLGCTAVAQGLPTVWCTF